MKVLCALIAIFSGCLAAQCAAQESPKDPAKQEWRDIISTSLSKGDCEPAASAKDQGGRICKGVEGYSLLLKGDDLKPEINLIAPNGRRFPLRFWNVRDRKFHSLHRYAIWTVVHVSRKSIALVLSAEIAPRQDYSYTGSYDIIARVSPGPVCIVGSLSTPSPSGGDSIDIATFPRRRRCLGLHERETRDWFATASRLAKEGQIRPARLALAMVHKPSQRFLVYYEISKAQFKAGDSMGARHTLMRARAEALRNPFRDDLRFTLIHVVAGMVEAGLDEKAKSDIKLFPPQDWLRMYLMVASLQGGKRDLVSAKRTFQEAIQLEPKESPRWDSNLYEIASAQARIGLKDEARQTASMIRDPSLRQSVELNIRE